MAGTPAQNDNNAAGNNDSSRKTVGLLAGWPTPVTNDGTGSMYAYGSTRADGTRPTFLKLPGAAALADPTNNSAQMQAMVASWATPSARDWRSASGSDEFLAGRAEQTCGKPLSEQAFTQVGVPSSGSPAETASTGQLNPAFSLWLMGYPDAWVSCGARAMQSFRKLPNKS